MPHRRLSFIPPAAGAYTPVGSMTAWITILNPAGQDADGRATSPSTFATCWAAVRALAGRELDKAQQVDQEVSHLVTVFYFEGPKENMTIQWEGRVLQIIGIQDPDGQHRELRMLCVERGQNAGQPSV